METEAKFIVPDQATFNRLKRAARFGPYVRRDARTIKVQDRYLDTPDQRFYGRQFAVRLREAKGGAGLLLTLKGLGGAAGAIHEREEYQGEVPGLDIASWPQGDVRRLVEEIGGGEPLADLVTVEQTRTVSVLYHGERRVAECSLDQVSIRTADGPLKAYELEIELLPDGAISDLQDLAALLESDYALTPQPLSKFERAMLLTSPRQKEPAAPAPTPVPDPEPEASSPPRAEPEQEAPAQPAQAARAAAPPAKREPGVLPTDSAGAAARKIVRMHYEAMLANEEGTRAGEDPEALHDMRVATRRMRAALRLLQQYVQGGEAGRVTRGLRTLARALGGVRDLDVLIAHARNFRDGLPAAQQPDMDGLLDEWTAQRERGRKKLLRLLDSKEYARFKRRMDTFLSEEDVLPNQEHGAQPYQVRHVVGSAIWDHYEEVRAYETLMDAPTIEQMHSLRITGKYLRYTLEFFREVLPSEVGALIKDVVKMQDHLGDLHDADVAAGLVRTYLNKGTAHGKKDGQNESRAQPPPGLAAYLVEREATIRRLYERFFAPWGELSGPSWRARLAAAVAQL